MIFIIFLETIKNVTQYSIKVKFGHSVLELCFGFGAGEVVVL